MAVVVWSWDANCVHCESYCSTGEQQCALPHMVFCTGCDGCGCVELGCELCALWRLLFDRRTRVCTAAYGVLHCNKRGTKPAVTSYGFVRLLLQCRTPHAAVHTLFLLMMGIMMLETCWDRSLIINIRLVASCWFLSLHPAFMMHGHKSLKWGFRNACLRRMNDKRKEGIREETVVTELGEVREEMLNLMIQTRHIRSLFTNINQLDALNFMISLFQASTCFGHMYSSSGGQNCVIQSLVSSHL